MAEEPSRAIEAMTEAELSELKHRAFSRGNPLYAWRAFLICRMRKHKIPEWVMECLADAAIRLTHLAELSGGKYGDGEIGLSDLPFGNRTEINPAEAMGKLGWALRLSNGTGSNAFLNLANDFGKMVDAAVHEAAVAYEETPAGQAEAARSATAQIAARRGIGGRDATSVERSVRRRIKKGQDLRPKPSADKT